MPRGTCKWENGLTVKTVANPSLNKRISAAPSPAIPESTTIWRGRYAKTLWYRSRDATRLDIPANA